MLFLSRPAVNFVYFFVNFFVNFTLMLPLMKALPLAGFVFWLISFPMNGFLMPDTWGTLLLYFTLSSALSYFLLPWVLQEKSFDPVSRSGSFLVVLLTAASPLFQVP
ncbi:hypothetical protein MNBD_NITROSPIRAE02-659, partial [hydrothermal vent metagenome]